MSSKPLQVKDKVFYWQEDKSKIRSDGSKGGIWLKGKVISIEGAMVGLDLGTRLIKVNIRMKPSLRGNLELIVYCQKSENPCRRSKAAPLPTPRRRSHSHQLLSQNPQCHYASRERQLPSLQHLIQQRTCSSRTSHPFLNKHTGIVYVKERSTFSTSLQEVPDSVNAVHSQALRLGLP